MSAFFINRPVFAWVIALLIAIAGILALRVLPIAQYPNIAPPTVMLRASYPGASAHVVEQTVTAVIEREMNGIEGLLYTSSKSSSNSMEATITFKQGVDINTAAVEVQNRLKDADPYLPEAVRRNGITLEKASANFAFMIALFTDGTTSELDLGEYTSAQVVPALRRVDGVGSVDALGMEHAIRIWLDNDKMRMFNITPSDVSNAVAINNVRITAGTIGGENVSENSPISVLAVADDTFSTPEEFGNIVLREKDNGIIRIRDIARVEIGSSMYMFNARINGNPASMMMVSLTSGANSVATAKMLRQTLDKLSQSFPPGVDYAIPYDTSPFVELAIKRVVVTLLEAMALVFIVMFLFLQSFRATIIPTLVVPVALLGTMAIMYLCGFSMNMLTMFAMVMAIGILVDDAIVVVENTERLIREEHLDAKSATKKAMQQIGNAIIGITVVLAAVFIPMAFFSGAVGNIYRQFSMTLCISIVLSAMLALTLTPAMCATLLKPHSNENRVTAWIEQYTHRYSELIRRILIRPVRFILIYAGIALMAIIMYVNIPTAFIPYEDQGGFFAFVQLPAGAKLSETMSAIGTYEKHVLENEPIKTIMTIGGFSLFGDGPNAGLIFVNLKDWDERNESVDDVVNRLNGTFGMGNNNMIMAMNLPPLLELAMTDGFDFQLQNLSGLSYQEFSAVRDTLIAKASENPLLQDVQYAGLPDSQQIQIKLDREKANMLHVSNIEIASTLSTLYGAEYIGDVMLAGQIRRIMIQADGKYREDIEGLRHVYIRSDDGNFVPLDAIAKLEWGTDAADLSHYNGLPAFGIQGGPAHGVSSGEAMLAMEEVAATLPAGVGYEWSAQSYEERLSGNQASLLYALSILIVFLALAALYESFAVPVSVLMIIPLGAFGALIAILLRGMPNDIYFKVGLVATIGLSAKNAILIVEMAKDIYQSGKSLVDSAVEAALLRLRPIIMTSLAFGLGITPLIISTGAGSGAQRAVGTGVLGGIIMATAAGIFLVPLFFVIVCKIFHVKRSK